MYIAIIILIVGLVGFGYLATEKDILTKNDNDEKGELVSIDSDNKQDNLTIETDEEADNNDDVEETKDDTDDDSKKIDDTTITKKDTPPEPVTTTPVPSNPTPKPPVTTPTPSTTKSYTAEETYFVSNNKYTIDVTLGVKDGVVTTADVMYGNKDTGYQHPLQKKFDESYSTQVIGQKLESISLSRVGGASLTTQAFNKAVQDIIKQI